MVRQLAQTASQPELSFLSWHRVNMLGALEIREEAAFSAFMRKERYEALGLWEQWDTVGLNMLPPGCF